MRKLLIMLLLITSSILGAPAYSQEKPECYRLDNGLTVYLLQDRTVPSVSVYLGYKVGSRNEQTGRTGISHLLEHLLFRGTKSFPEEKLNNILYTTGADYNAFTSYDLTVYYETLPAKYLETALAIESDRMQNSELSEEAVAKEKKIVTAELEGGKNDPSSVLDDEVMSVHFKSHPYRWPVIGFKEDVAGLSRDFIASYYKSHYVPNNAILSIGGGFDRDEAKRLVAKYFGGIPAGREPESETAKEPPMQSRSKVYVEDPGKTSYVELVFHSDKITGGDFYALKVLDSILYAGKSTRLYKALVVPALATSVSTYVWESRDPGVFTITASYSKGDSPEKIEGIIFDEIERLHREPPTERELEKAKNTLTAGFLRAKESISDLALSIVYYGILGDSNYVADFEKNIKSVTAKQVQDAAKKYLRRDNCTTGYLKGVGAGSPGQAVTGPDSKMRHAVPKAKSLPSSDPTDFAFDRFVLDNGLTVIVRPNKNLHSVRIGGYIAKSGKYMEPEGKEGISSMTAAMLERGTKTKSFAEIAETKDFNAISASLSARSERTGISGWMLRDKAETGIELLADMMRNPSFPEDELAKCRKQKKAVIDLENDDTDSSAINEFIRLIHPGDPRRGHCGSGTHKSIDSITREDLEKFHRECYRPENTVLIFYGNVTGDEARRLAERYWGTWRPGGKAAQEPPKAMKESPVKPVEKALKIDGKTQSSIIMGGYGVEISSKDYCAFTVFNKIMGGSTLTSRLGRDIRVSQGLVYGIYSANSPDLTPALLLIIAGTAPENTEKVIASTKKTIRELLDKGVSEKEFADTKANILNSLLVHLEDPGQQIDLLSKIEYHGLGKDYLKRLIDAYESLTIDDVNAAGRKYIDPDRMKIVTAGKN